MSDEPNAPSRDQLATDIRSAALRLYWFNQAVKPGNLAKALEEAQKLLKAVATYGELLAAELAGDANE
jgi:hypothetical protein